MSRLSEAMYNHMAYITFEDHRPFCFRDFTYFRDGDEIFTPRHGTIRNCFSRFRKEGKIELQFLSAGMAFYTLSGYRLGKRAMTDDRTEVKRANALADIIGRLPKRNQAVHDVRLRFECKGIWDILSKSGFYSPNQRSKDIRLPKLEFDQRGYEITIHRTDTVSVIVSCSAFTVILDEKDLRRLTEDLTRVEERLAQIIQNGCIKVGIPYGIKIPRHVKWIVTMWHFGVDSLTELSREAFQMTLEKGMGVLERIYTKKIGEKQYVRHEFQEYPNKSLEEAVQAKLRSQNVSDSESA